ncbi:histidinol-phosphatase HisJ [Leptotrichia sp. oral taxon 847]|uniref:histidinol-phosphatase HisJ n=1 Tax=Leptotrichia sp. oral taxon 847 TaxID=1785996 RepID=UPI0007681A46|nr:histidinol-phosphatase HisJ [Leptotrichia sp. oral taxon 847]AMD94182.1 histidinol phosphate phosphatase [Leptotrichia sp. oral taxon 847]
MEKQKNISFPSNLHGHTTYCDGKNKAEEYILKAIGKNFISIGLSGHSYVYFDKEPNMSLDGTLKYIEEMKFLKEKYKNKIQVYIGIEADFYSGFNPKVDKNLGLDYRIGSVHYVKDKVKDEYYCVDATPEILAYAIKNYDNGDEKSLILAYYNNIIEMIHTQKPDILGHLDLVRKFNSDGRYFDENSEWYNRKVDEVLDEIAKADIIVEINTGGISRGWTKTPYPSVSILEKIFKRNIPITLSSDAHTVENIDYYFRESVEIAKKVGFKSLKIMRDGKFYDFEI